MLISQRNTPVIQWFCQIQSPVSTNNFFIMFLKNWVCWSWITTSKKNGQNVRMSYGCYICVFILFVFISFLLLMKTALNPYLQMLYKRGSVVNRIMKWILCILGKLQYFSCPYLERAITITWRAIVFVHVYRYKYMCNN